MNFTRGNCPSSGVCNCTGACLFLDGKPLIPYPQLYEQEKPMSSVDHNFVQVGVSHAYIANEQDCEHPVPDVVKKCCKDFYQKEGYSLHSENCRVLLETKIPLADVDMVSQPPHYKAPNDPDGVYEVWEVLWAHGLGEAKAKASAIEYILRCDKKGEKIQDLKKARTYIDMLIKKLEDK